MDVKVLDENSNKPLAILFDVKPGLYLSEVRQVVSDQVSDVMPSSEYQFKYQGTQISKVQETVTTLQKIALSGDDSSFFILPLPIPISNTVDHTISTKSGLESDSSDQTNHMKSTPPHTESPEAKTKMLHLRSPSHAEIRNLRIFTDTEIENGRGRNQTIEDFGTKKFETWRTISYNMAPSNDEHAHYGKRFKNRLKKLAYLRNLSLIYLVSM